MRVGARPPPLSVAERQRAYRQRCQEARKELARTKVLLAESEARCAALAAENARLKEALA